MPARRKKTRVHRSTETSDIRKCREWCGSTSAAPARNVRAAPCALRRRKTQHAYARRDFGRRLRCRGDDCSDSALARPGGRRIPVGSTRRCEVGTSGKSPLLPASRKWLWRWRSKEALHTASNRRGHFVTHARAPERSPEPCAPSGSGVHGVEKRSAVTGHESRFVNGQQFFERASADQASVRIKGAVSASATSNLDHIGIALLYCVTDAFVSEASLFSTEALLPVASASRQCSQ